MLERNRYLVDHAACLLAVYNGEWQGGTTMMVRYAGKLGDYTQSECVVIARQFKI